MNKYVILFLFCWLQIIAVKGQDDTNFNRSYLYNPNAPLKCNIQMAVSENQGTAFIKIEKNVSDSLTPPPELTYKISSNFRIPVLSVNNPVNVSHLIKQEENTFFYKINFPVDTASRYLLLNVKTNRDAKAIYQFDKKIWKVSDKSASNMFITRPGSTIPYFRNYFNNSDSLSFSPSFSEADTLFVHYYSHEFNPAPPIMGGDDTTKPKLEIDSTFKIAANQSYTFNNEGLYLVQHDTSTFFNKRFRIEPTYYPRFVKIEDIIKPLRYIMETEEFNKVTSSENKKRSLDEFWLNLPVDQETAKEIIKNYYQQVKLTNQYFTSFKQGWKTDQGMVYLLFGIPDKVEKSGITETWYYKSRSFLPSLKFNFQYVPNLFTSEFYVLRRNHSYRNTWYRNIDLWRKGRKTLKY